MSKQRIRVDELFNILSNENAFFSVEFERRTNRADGTAVQGDRRRMICRSGVQNYKLGVIPDAVRAAEDFRHAVLTVWDVQAYHRNRRQGMEQWDAGRNAWRRIDLTTVSECSAVPMDDLPPDIIRDLHDITNAYRLANMPREPLSNVEVQ